MPIVDEYKTMQEEDIPLLWNDCDNNLEVYSSVVKRYLHELVEIAPSCFPRIPWKDIKIEFGTGWCYVTFDKFIEEDEIIVDDYHVSYYALFIDEVTLYNEEDTDYCFERHKIKIFDGLFGDIIKYHNLLNTFISDYSFFHSMEHYSHIKEELFDIQLDETKSKKDNVTMAIDFLIKNCLVFADVKNFSVFEDVHKLLSKSPKYDVDFNASSNADVVIQDVKNLFSYLLEYLEKTKVKRKEMFFIQRDDGGAGNGMTAEELNIFYNENKKVSNNVRILADRLRIYGEMSHYEEDIDDKFSFFEGFSERLFVLAFLINTAGSSYSVYQLKEEDYRRYLSLK